MFLGDSKVADEDRLSPSCDLPELLFRFEFDQEQHLVVHFIYLKRASSS